MTLTALQSARIDMLVRSFSGTVTGKEQKSNTARHTPEGSRWITVHPGGHDDGHGQPVLISGSGQVLGGMGGKFNGQHIGDVAGWKQAGTAKPGGYGVGGTHEGYNQHLATYGGAKAIADVTVHGTPVKHAGGTFSARVAGGRAIEKTLNQHGQGQTSSGAFLERHPDGGVIYHGGMGAPDTWHDFAKHMSEDLLTHSAEHEHRRMMGRPDSTPYKDEHEAEGHAYRKAAMKQVRDYIRAEGGIRAGRTRTVGQELQGTTARTGDEYRHNLPSWAKNQNGKHTTDQMARLVGDTFPHLGIETEDDLREYLMGHERQRKADAAAEAKARAAKVATTQPTAPEQKAETQAATPPAASGEYQAARDFPKIHAYASGKYASGEFARPKDADAAERNAQESEAAAKEAEERLPEWLAKEKEQPSAAATARSLLAMKQRHAVTHRAQAEATKAAAARADEFHRLPREEQLRHVHAAETPAAMALAHSRQDLDAGKANPYEGALQALTGPSFGHMVNDPADREHLVELASHAIKHGLASDSRQQLALDSIRTWVPGMAGWTGPKRQEKVDAVHAWIDTAHDALTKAHGTLHPDEGAQTAERNAARQSLSNEEQQRKAEQPAAPARERPTWDTAPRGEEGDYANGHLRFNRESWQTFAVDHPASIAEYNRLHAEGKRDDPYDPRIHHVIQPLTGSGGDHPVAAPVLAPKGSVSEQSKYIKRGSYSSEQQAAVDHLNAQKVKPPAADAVPLFADAVVKDRAKEPEQPRKKQGQAALFRERSGRGAIARSFSGPHDYSTTQVDLPEHIAKRLRSFARTIPAADLADDGREEHPHITVKYGLHTADADDVAPIVANHPPLSARFGKTAIFPASETGGDYDVVNVAVHSPDLHRLNAALARALPHTDTHPTYQPHATIAYVKAGKGSAYAGSDFLEGQRVTFPHVTFSSKDEDQTRLPLSGEGNPMYTQASDDEDDQPHQHSQPGADGGSGSVHVSRPMGSDEDDEPDDAEDEAQGETSTPQKQPVSAALRRLYQRISAHFAGGKSTLSASDWDTAWKHARGHAGGTASAAARAQGISVMMAEHGAPPHETGDHATQLIPCPSCTAAGMQHPDCACGACADDDPAHCQCAPHLLNPQAAAHDAREAYAERPGDPFLVHGPDAYRLFMEAPRPFSEAQEWIGFLPRPGTFTHPQYGAVTMTAERNADFVSKFNAGVYQKQVPLDAEHQTKLSGAVGWITALRLAEDGSAEARVDWTHRGRALLADNRYRYVSPEFFDTWQAPDTGERISNVVIGGAVTTRPFFKESHLRPLVASEQGTYYVPALDSAPRGQETQIMPEPTTSTLPAQFTEEQIRRFTEMEAENASLRQMAEQAQEQAIQAAERVTALEATARRKAFAEQASEWFGPISDHVAFMEALPTDEARTFYAMQQDAHAAQLKEAGLFRERGVRGEEHGGEGATAEGQLEVLARARVEKNPGLPYHRAYAETLKEHPELYAQYESEHRAL